MEIFITHLTLLDTLMLITFFAGLIAAYYGLKQDIESVKQRNSASDAFHVDIKKSLDSLKDKVEKDYHTMDRVMGARISDIEARSRATDIFNVRLEERVAALQVQNTRILNILEERSNALGNSQTKD